MASKLENLLDIYETRLLNIVTLIEEKVIFSYSTSEKEILGIYKRIGELVYLINDILQNIKQPKDFILATRSIYGSVNALVIYLANRQEDLMKVLGENIKNLSESAKRRYHLYFGIAKNLLMIVYNNILPLVRIYDSMYKKPLSEWLTKKILMIVELYAENQKRLIVNTIVKNLPDS